MSKISAPTFRPRKLTRKAAHPKVKDLILLVHARHEGILGKRIPPCRILFIGSFNLFVQSLDVRREEAMEIKCLSLFFWMSAAFIEL